MKVIHEVISVTYNPDETSDRIILVCPDCKLSHAALFIPTSMGHLFDPVECDCGAELTPRREVVEAYVKENPQDATGWPFAEVYGN
jgi:hypothetical protein